MKQPPSSRWYVPWVAATLAIVGLMATAIAAIEVLTASPPPARLSPMPRSTPLEHVDDGRPGMESIRVER